MNLTLRYAAHSHRGLVRDGNQDAVYAGPRLLAVADGMGGMAAGDVASSIVIAAMEPLDEDVPGDALVDALRGSVEAANQQLRATVEANPQLEGMGTTLTALLFTGSRAGLVHIGDSRAYLLRDGEFAQITKDDTYVQMLVDEGRISSEEAGSHPQRSLLTRAMDGRDLDPEYSIRPLLPGDRYLICSDGLSGVVSEETIAETLKQNSDPQACVDRLINLALRGGGPDNITVIVADTTDEDIVEATPIVGGAAVRPDTTGDGGPPTESTPAARASALAGPSQPSVAGPPTADPDATPTMPLPMGQAGAAPPGAVPPGGAPPGGAPSGAAPPAGLAAGPAPEPAVVAAGSGPSAPSRARRLLPSVLLLALLVGVLGGGLWFGWWYIQTSYYVGVSETGEVAVFRGVPGQVAGIRLSREYDSSEFSVNGLNQEARDRLHQGTGQVGSAGEARTQMHELICDNLLDGQPPPDFCPPPAAGELPDRPVVPDRPEPEPDPSQPPMEADPGN